MRRSFRLFQGDFEMLITNSELHRNQFSERLIIERQANLVRVSERQREDEKFLSTTNNQRNCSGTDYSSPSPNKNLLSQDEIDERIRSVEAAHEAAATRNLMRYVPTPSSSGGSRTKSTADTNDLIDQQHNQKPKFYTMGNDAPADLTSEEASPLFKNACGNVQLDIARAASRVSCVAAPNWPDALPGWTMLLDTTIPIDAADALTAPQPAVGEEGGGEEEEGGKRGGDVGAPMVVQKIFCFLDQPQTYRFLASVGAAVEELGLGEASSTIYTTATTCASSSAAADTCTQGKRTSASTGADNDGHDGEADSSSSSSPSSSSFPTSSSSSRSYSDHRYAIPTVEWMWSEVTVTMLSTPQTFLLANFLNDTEAVMGKLRNASLDGVASSNIAWSEALRQKVETRARRSFLWMYNNEDSRDGVAKNMQSLYIQWGNRAEYLISRKSRERKEFRPNLTLSAALQEGGERKRRAERRKFKDKIAEVGAAAMGLEREDFERYSFDTLPRELREQMEEDRSKVGGMQPIEQRLGSITAFSRLH